MLATAIAVGGFGGSIIAGILTDMGLLTVAILMPAIPLILGIVLIGMNMPNQKREGKVTIDVPGMIALMDKSNDSCRSCNWYHCSYCTC